MVAVNGNILSKVANFAKTKFNNAAQNPAKGSAFDALNKLGINNTDDLKAGLKKFVSNPKDTLKSASETLKGSGFGKDMLGNVSGKLDKVNDNISLGNKGNDQSIFNKLGINTVGDLKAGISLLKEDPNGAISTAAKTLGFNEEQAAKMGKKAQEYFA